MGNGEWLWIIQGGERGRVEVHGVDDVGSVRGRNVGLERRG